MLCENGTQHKHKEILLFWPVPGQSKLSFQLYPCKGIFLAGNKDAIDATTFDETFFEVERNYRVTKNARS